MLARRSGFIAQAPAEAMPRLPEDADDDAFEHWLQSAAARLGLEAEAVTAPFPEVEHLLKHAGPAVLRLPGTGGRFLVLLKHRLRYAIVITPDLATRKVAVERIARLLGSAVAEPLQTQIDELLSAAEVPEERRDRARELILNEQLGNTQVAACWLLRLPPSSNFWLQLRQASVPRNAALLLFTHGIRQALFILGWWIIAQGALEGRFDYVWLSAWGLVLLTSVPFELAVVWLQSLLTVTLGRLFKQRLLFGSLQLQPEEIRHQGIGQFLGRVLESDAVETMMLGGGFASLIAGIELISAMVVLTLGAGGWAHMLLLQIWLLATFLLTWRYYRRSQVWRVSHRHLINSLIERMVGHRTRLAQEAPQRWHDDEDQGLSAYMHLSQSMDATFIQLISFVSRGWLILGMAGLAYVLVNDEAAPAMIAVSLGGVLLASQALNRLVGGLHSLVGVFNAWRQVGPLFHAAARNRDEQMRVAPILATASESEESGKQPLLVARDIVFRYREYGQPVLRGCDLSILSGDRLLLEGASGGGKSTLAALITGLRAQTSGLLLLHGLDKQTLGSLSWRRRVVAAPQFHENHVLTETLAFNLLMGRRWPPAPGDLDEADQLCRELGLGDLLDRMPAGLQQMVGESGWQLSHGERSRLFIARALLQGADLIVLDESFAALDPLNLQRALQCVLARAPTLLVIAHP